MLNRNGSTPKGPNTMERVKTLIKNNGDDMNIDVVFEQFPILKSTRWSNPSNRRRTKHFQGNVRVHEARIRRNIRSTRRLLGEGLTDKRLVYYRLFSCDLSS